MYTLEALISTLLWIGGVSLTAWAVAPILARIADRKK